MIEADGYSQAAWDCDSDQIRLDFKSKLQILTAGADRRVK